MAKYELRQKAFELRQQGKSYNQIKKQLGVSKSSLSLWLRKYPLSHEQIRLLRDVSEVRIEKFRQTMLAKRERRFSETYNLEKIKLLPLSKKELLIAGLFLYWGEGVKDLKSAVGLYNTDPLVIKFGIYWYTRILNILPERIRIQLHLYSDMNVNEEMQFWSKELKIPVSRFARPYIKQSKRTNINHKGSFGHGTCGLLVNNTIIKEQIIAGIKVIADYYGNKI